MTVRPVQEGMFLRPHHFQAAARSFAQEIARGVPALPPNQHDDPGSCFHPVKNHLGGIQGQRRLTIKAGDQTTLAFTLFVTAGE